MQLQHCRKAVINTAAIGNVTVIPGNQLGAGIGTLKVWQILLNGAGANTISFQSGATTSYPIVFTTAGSSATLQATGVPWATADPGQALVMTTTSAQGVTGEVWYTLA